jgi:hypothetical protein
MGVRSIIAFPCLHASENPHALIKMKPTHTATPVMKIVNVR